MSHRTSRSFAGRTPAPPRSLRSATCSTTYICSTLCLQSGFIKEIGPTCTSTDSTHLSAASRCGSLLLSASAGVRSSDDVGAFEGWSCRPNNTQLLEFVKHAFRLRTKLGFILQNAMTSSRERTSAEAEGYRIESALMDCVTDGFLVAKGDFRTGLLGLFPQFWRKHAIAVGHDSCFDGSFHLLQVQQLALQ